MSIDSGDANPVVRPTPDEVARPGPAARTFDREAFWALAVGVPVLVSVLRLWAEAGGDLQTTLLLVANVGPVNLFAALVVTATWLVSATLVAVFAIGSMTREGAAAPAAPLTWPSFFAQLAAGAPYWLVIGTFVLAALTWQLAYLPLLILAGCATFPWRPKGGLWLVGWAAAAVGYIAAFGPAAVQAIAGRHVVPAVLIILPPVLLALGAARPIPATLARPFAVLAQSAAVVLVLFAVTPILSAPVLPLSVVTVAEPDDQPPKPIRGHVVEVNDTTTAILRVRGGVEFIPNAKIAARILCPDRGQAARYRVWVHGVHIEDSLLQGVGRSRRPVVMLDPRCRPTVPEREAGQDFVG
jgi:hypothetical protein